MTVLRALISTIMLAALTGLIFVGQSNFASAASNNSYLPLSTISHGPVANDGTTDQIIDKTNLVSIPEELKLAWAGHYRVPATSVLNYTPSLEEVIKNYLGTGTNNVTNYKTYNYNPVAIAEWLRQFSARVNVPVQKGSLKIDNGRVQSFDPPVPGKNLNLYRSTLAVLDALDTETTSFELAVDTTAPPDLSGTNNLGIRQLIGRGQSSFKGSPHNRRINIGVGVSKMKGVIIPPGQTFSFNDHLGPVEAYAGFVPELVIKAEGTVPELGGGLCQVSSTTFRAAMDAGLPIMQRKNHSYAVSYYGPQGTDATIYPGVIDLKFTNDTPGSILIWPYLRDQDTLIFDFYGTSDGRDVTLNQPVQFDRKSDGSLKASWTRTVIKNDHPVTTTYNSTYQPPALFHKKEQFVPATPAPGTVAPTTPDATGQNPTTPGDGTTPSPTNTNSSSGSGNTNSTPTNSNQ